VSSDAVFLLLIELIVARIADALQSVESDLKNVCRDVFSLQPHKASAGAEQVLLRSGQAARPPSALAANLRESLVSLNRMLQFFLNNAATWMRPELAAAFCSAVRDIRSLD